MYNKRVCVRHDHRRGFTLIAIIAILAALLFLFLRVLEKTGVLRRASQT